MKTSAARVTRYTVAMATLALVVTTAVAGDYEDAVTAKNDCATKKAAVNAAASMSFNVRADAKERYDQAVKDYAAKMGKMTSAQRKCCGGR